MLRMGTDSIASDRVKIQVRNLRLARFQKVRYLGLLDKKDCGTSDDPLKGFAAEQDAEALFVRSMGRTGQVVALVNPTEAHSTTAFMSALVEFVTEERA